MLGVSFYGPAQTKLNSLSQEQQNIISSIFAHNGLAIKGEGRYTDTQVISHIGIMKTFNGSIDLIALPLNNKDQFLIHPIKLTNGFPEISERKNYGKIDKRRLSSNCFDEIIRSYNINSVSGGLLGILPV